MKNYLKKYLIIILRFLQHLGFDPIKILSLKHMFRFLKDKKDWINQGGVITQNHMILSDYEDKAGEMKGHYFHQDLLVAKLIYEAQPKRHVDIGSRIDGFVAHVASFREIEVLDIRPLEKSEHKNIKFIQADLMSSLNLGFVDSISCLHVIEHFGLGRYGDQIDIDGHIKGIDNLIKMLSYDGTLYISFPISQEDEVHFNANRVFKADTILKLPSIKENMKLIRFDYVNQFGRLYTDVSLKDLSIDTRNNCGIYTFKKIKDRKNIKI